MRIIFGTLSILGLLTIAAPASVYAQSDPPTLKVKSGKPYLHKHSGLSVPVNLGGMQRTGTQVYFKNELDVSVQYENDSASEAVTVYIFRNTNGNIPIWFDRAREHIEKRPNFGTAVMLTEPIAFAIAGQKNASSMRVVFALTDSAYKSSGLALIPVGEFYVKVRVTSSTRTPQELENWLSQVITEIKWPDATTPHPLAVATKPCQTALSFEGAPNRIVQKTANILFEGIMNAASSTINESEENLQTPAPYCRDPYDIFPAGVYRRDNATNAYLLALSDSGLAIDVRPDATTTLMSQGEKVDPKNDGVSQDTPIPYGINLKIQDKILTYDPRDRLPDPDQLLQIVNSEEPNITASTWGKEKGNVQLDSNTVKP
jgi:hypothetical protein